MKKPNAKKDKNNKKDAESKKVSFDAAAKAPKHQEPAVPSRAQESVWQTFSNHPLVRVAPIILIPYTLYIAYYFLVLKRPDLVSTATMGLVQLRPALSVADERQLLVIGSMSSGTVQVSADLYDHLNLEIGHEVSNTETHFARDGTVSWFHVVRYLHPPEERTAKLEALKELCTNYTANMGLHPRMYKSSSSCSQRKKWSSCWARECVLVVNSEWGCAYNNHTCETPFHATLHQVRHPMRTVESLVTKFCQGGLEGTLHPSFVRFMSVLFPSRDWNALSCIEAAGHYVVDYNTALLEAAEAGLLDGMYKIEESSPCDVARMAGLMDRDTTIYTPTFDRVSKLCDIMGDVNPAHELMVSKKHRINEGQVELSWEGLRGGKHGSRRPEGDTSLEGEVKQLTLKLGYDPDESREFDVEEKEF